MANLKQSEASILERNRVALENVKNQPLIATEMADLGYDATKIFEGEQLLAETRAAFNFNKQEDDETTEASAQFKNQEEILTKQYKKHRKRAKTIFRKDPELLKRLELLGRVPNAYDHKMQTISKFYTELKDTALLERLKQLKITEEVVLESQIQIQNVNTARATYLKEVGESQDATQQKNAAFVKMDDWMRDFYDIADIALEDQPQLMEALGRKRKS